MEILGSLLELLLGQQLDFLLEILGSLLDCLLGQQWG